jgi:hypothetical protein
MIQALLSVKFSPLKAFSFSASVNYPLKEHEEEVSLQNVHPYPLYLRFLVIQNSILESDGVYISHFICLAFFIPLKYNVI